MTSGAAASASCGCMQVPLNSLPELYEEDEALLALSMAAVLSRQKSSLRLDRLPRLFSLWGVDWADLEDFLVSAAKSDRRRAASMAEVATTYLLYLMHANEADLHDNKYHWRAEVCRSWNCRRGCAVAVPGGKTAGLHLLTDVYASCCHCCLSHPRSVLPRLGVSLLRRYIQAF